MVMGCLVFGGNGGQHAKLYLVVVAGGGEMLLSTCCSLQCLRPIIMRFGWPSSK